MEFDAHRRMKMITGFMLFQAFVISAYGCTEDPKLIVYDSASQSLKQITSRKEGQLYSLVYGNTIADMNFEQDETGINVFYSFVGDIRIYSYNLNVKKMCEVLTIIAEQTKIKLFVKLPGDDVFYIYASNKVIYMKRTKPDSISDSVFEYETRSLYFNPNTRVLHVMEDRGSFSALKRWILDFDGILKGAAYENQKNPKWKLQINRFVINANDSVLFGSDDHSLFRFKLFEDEKVAHLITEGSSPYYLTLGPNCLYFTNSTSQIFSYDLENETISVIAQAEKTELKFIWTYDEIITPKTTETRTATTENTTTICNMATTKTTTTTTTTTTTGSTTGSTTGTTKKWPIGPNVLLKPHGTLKKQKGIKKPRTTVRSLKVSGYAIHLPGLLDRLGCSAIVLIGIYPSYFIGFNVATTF